MVGPRSEGCPWRCKQDLFWGAFSLGRDALWQIASRIASSSTCVWLPAYCCDQLVSPFLAAGLPLRFYDVNCELRVEWDVILTARRKCGAGSHTLVLIDFFGYPQDVPADFLAESRQYFDVIVRDAAHMLPVADLALLSGRREGYLVFSLRKPLPIPDLALVFATNVEGGPIQAVESRRPPTWRRQAFVWFEMAGLLSPWWTDRSIYRRGRQWLKESKTMGMEAGSFSVAVAERISMKDVAEARRSNARRLASAYGSRAVFRDVPTDACPYLFPIFSGDPVTVQADFARRGIETTRFWRIGSGRDRTAYPGAHRIAESVLCLPVHQDIGGDAMDILVKAAEAIV